MNNSYVFDTTHHNWEALLKFLPPDEIIAYKVEHIERILHVHLTLRTFDLIMLKFYMMQIIGGFQMMLSIKSINLKKGLDN